MLDGFYYIVDIQKHIRQQTTTNDYCRQQAFNQRIVLDRWCFFAAYKANDMKSNKYKQSVIPKAETPNEWSRLKLQQLRKLVFEYIKNKYSGTTIIDGKKENVRLAVQFQKGGKYYYNIEINKKKAHA